MIDDDEGKARRNLVVFSAAVLLSMWLGFSLAEVATNKLLGVALKVEPWRAWSAAWIVLLYLTYRYHFNGGGKLAIATLARQCKLNIERRIDTLVQKSPDHYSARKWWAPRLKELLEKNEAEMQVYGQEKGVNNVTRMVRLTPSTKGFSGNFKLSMHWYENNQTQAQPGVHIKKPIMSHEEIVYFSLSWNRRWWIRLQAVCEELLSSDEAPALYAPVVLCALASGVIAYHFGRAVFG